MVLTYHALFGYHLSFGLIFRGVTSKEHLIKHYYPTQKMNNPQQIAPLGALCNILWASRFLPSTRFKLNFQTSKRLNLLIESAFVRRYKKSICGKNIFLYSTRCKYYFPLRKVENTFHTVSNIKTTLNYEWVLDKHWGPGGAFTHLQLLQLNWFIYFNCTKWLMLMRLRKLEQDFWKNVFDENALFS